MLCARTAHISLTPAADLDEAARDLGRTHASARKVAAVRWAADCRSAGLAVGCFRPPSVPDGISRLRLTARADLSEAQIERAVRVIGEARP